MNRGGIKVPDNTLQPVGLNRLFMQDDVVRLFQTKSGQDVTNALDGMRLDPGLLASQKVCLRNLFFIGKVDNRNSVQCQFAQCEPVRYCASR